MPELRTETIREEDLGTTAVSLDKAWIQSFYRPLLLGLMMGCFLLGLTHLIAYIASPAFSRSDGLFITLFGTLASLNGCLMAGVVASLQREFRRKVVIRIAEPLGWLVAFRLVAWTVGKDWPPPVDLFLNPFGTLFDLPFILASFLIPGAWILALTMNKNLLDMALQPDEVSYIERAFGRLSDPVENTLRSDRQGMLDRFITMWIVLGIFQLVFVAVKGFSENFQAAGEDSRTLNHLISILQSPDGIPENYLALLGYFFLGFLVVGQARFVALRTRWALEGLSVENSRFRSWNHQVAALVAVPGLLAASLVVGETRQIKGVIDGIVMGIMKISSYLFGILGYLLSLLPQGEVVEETESNFQPLPELVESEPVPQRTGFEVPDWIFWIFAALILFFVMDRLWGTRTYTWAWLMQRLQEFWDRLLRGVDEAVHLIRTTLTGEETAEAGATGVRRRRLRTQGELDEAVIYAYLSTLDVAADHGVARRDSESPLDYQPRLDEFLDEQAADPERQHDTQGITNAFLKAKYAEPSVSDDDVRISRNFLDRLKALFD